VAAWVWAGECYNGCLTQLTYFWKKFYPIRIILLLLNGDFELENQNTNFKPSWIIPFLVDWPGFYLRPLVYKLIPNRQPSKKIEGESLIGMFYIFVLRPSILFTFEYYFFCISFFILSFIVFVIKNQSPIPFFVLPFGLACFGIPIFCVIFLTFLFKWIYEFKTYKSLKISFLTNDINEIISLSTTYSIQDIKENIISIITKHDKDFQVINYTNDLYIIFNHCNVDYISNYPFLNHLKISVINQHEDKNISLTINARINSSTSFKYFYVTKNWGGNVLIDNINQLASGLISIRSDNS